MRGNLLIVNCELSIINYQLSIINYELSIVNYQLSIINCQLSIMNCQLSIINCQLSIVNCPFSTLPPSIPRRVLHRGGDDGKDSAPAHQPPRPPCLRRGRQRQSGDGSPEAGFASLYLTFSIFLFLVVFPLGGRATSRLPTTLILCSTS